CSTSAITAEVELIDLVFPRQAEAVEYTSGLPREEGLGLGAAHKRIARAYIDPTARDRGARPDGSEVNFLEASARRRIEGDELPAGHCGEIDDTIGDRNPGGDGIAHIGVAPPGRWATHCGKPGPFVPPAFDRRVQAQGHDTAPGGCQEAGGEGLL